MASKKMGPRTGHVEVRMGVVIQKASREIQEIADDYRQRHILPVCSKYKLEFMVGNGGWSFFMERSKNPEGTLTISASDDIDSINAFDLLGNDPSEMSAGEEDQAVRFRDAVVQNMHADLDDVIDDLNVEGIGRYDCFGLYISDVKQKDWK